MGRGDITNETFGRGYRSRAMGVHPSQAAEYNEMYKRHGITGAEHNPKDGQLEITSRKDRAKVMELRGMIDKDGGYGDYTG